MTLIEERAAVSPLAQIEAVAASLESLNAVLDVCALAPEELLAVGVVYGRCVRLAQAGALLVAGEVADSGAFRRDGERNAADWLGNQLGVAAGEAYRNLETAKKLRDRPQTEHELRQGKLSPTQADIVTGGSVDDEAPLLAAAKRRGVRGLRGEAERLEAVRRGEADMMERHRAVHARRHLRTWTANGEFCFSGSTTPDDGARLLAALEPETQRLFRLAHQESRQEPTEAYALDALLNTVAGVAVQPKRPTAALTLRADAAAIVRGYVTAGEQCEIDGVGPIPVTIARSLLVDCDIHGVMFNGVDVHDVTSTRRSIPAAIRRALEARDPGCSVPWCDQTKGLQIDHIWEFAKQGPTALENLVRLCRTHHRLKTTLGWRITGPPGNRQWLPPPPG